MGGPSRLSLSCRNELIDPLGGGWGGVVARTPSLKFAVVCGVDHGDAGPVLSWFVIF